MNKSGRGSVRLVWLRVNWLQTQSKPGIGLTVCGIPSSRTFSFSASHVKLLVLVANTRWQALLSHVRQTIRPLKAAYKLLTLGPLFGISPTTSSNPDFAAGSGVPSQDGYAKRPVRCPSSSEDWGRYGLLPKWLQSVYSNTNNYKYRISYQ